MTAVHATDPTTRMDLHERRSVRDMAIQSSGFTIDELRQQARFNEFETLQAKLSWMVVSAFERSSGEES